MRVLFIVEPDFLFLHVGVRRVILFYVQKLIAHGVDVSFGTPKQGQIYLGKIDFIPSLNDLSEPEKPCWTSSSRKFDNSKTNYLSNPYATVKWTEQKATPEEYDINLVTAPWICSLNIPPLPRMMGIVYDLVPNLLACECLHFPNYIDIYDFAGQHDLGFRYYIANAERVLCISNATRLDFLTMYRTVKNIPSVITDIPFECNLQSSLTTSKKNTVLLVNALDWRKNLKGIKETLMQAANQTSFNLRVIGKERINLNDAIDFFEKISDTGVNVEWFRDASDDLLASQYSEASVLLFPSIYEGLGLPVLEAQESGVPVITSNTSSCIEVNMNQELCFHPNDTTGMANSLAGVLNSTMPIKKGGNLRSTLDAFLSEGQSILDIFTIS